MEVAAAEVALWRVLFRGVDGLFERDEIEALLAEMHEYQIYCKAMKPGGKGGLSAKAADLAEEVEERLLGHVFGFGDVAEHAEAEGVDASFVEGVELGECLCVAVFGCFDCFCFAGDGGIALERHQGAGVFWVICRPWTFIARLRTRSSFTVKFSPALSLPQTEYRVRFFRVGWRMEGKGCKGGVSEELSRLFSRYVMSR